MGPCHQHGILWFPFSGPSFVRIRHGSRIATCSENASQKCVRGALLFGKALPQLTVAEMVASLGAVFLAPFGRAAIVFIVKEVVFGFFPWDVSSEPLTHVPFVFIDGMSVLPNLPFIEMQMGQAAV
jgi:hypothetical protein